MRKTNPAKADLWISRITECRQSGLTDSRWCRENNIVLSSFYCWIKKLLIEASEIPGSKHEVTIPFKQDFVPLHVTSDISDSDTNYSVPATAIIIKVEGLSLEIQNGANEQTITNTINALINNRERINTFARKRHVHL